MSTYGSGTYGSGTYGSPEIAAVLLDYRVTSERAVGTAASRRVTGAASASASGVVTSRVRSS